MHFSTLDSFVSLLLLASYAHAAQPRGNINACLDAHKVPRIVKGSADWAKYATPFNLRLVYDPVAITVPETADHVSASVTCAAAAYVKVQAKGGGHSYASFSSGGQDGSLVIDMEKFSEIKVDPSQ
jgi:FAD/FMN-containing dehydrogenase